MQDCDDDGESAAGGRLLHLLQVADAKNVVVVVSRWCAPGVATGEASPVFANQQHQKMFNRVSPKAVPKLIVKEVVHAF